MKLHYALLSNWFTRYLMDTKINKIFYNFQPFFKETVTTCISHHFKTSLSFFLYLFIFLCILCWSESDHYQVSEFWNFLGEKILTSTLKCLPSFCSNQNLNQVFCLIDFLLIGKLSKINPCLDGTESFPFHTPSHFPSFLLQVKAHSLSDRANITYQVETIIHARVQILRLDGQTVGKTGSM